MIDARTAGPPHEPSPAEHQIANDESLPLAIQRITVGLLESARSDLRHDADDEFDEGIHGARKKLKRVRAILRLIRDEIGETAYRNENAVLRDTGRSIAAMRDARVLGETLVALLPPFDDSFAVTQAYLDERYRVAREHTDRTVIVAALDNLGAARSRFAAFAIEGVVRNEFAAIAPGLRRTYKRGRRDHRRSTEVHDDHLLHAWRKQVKYLRHQMEALVPIDPDRIGRMVGPLEELGELLGVDHDLAVLAHLIATDPAAAAGDADRVALAAILAERRAELAPSLHRLGAAIYSDTAGTFVARIGDLWASARP